MKVITRFFHGFYNNYFALTRALDYLKDSGPESPGCLMLEMLFPLSTFSKRRQYLATKNHAFGHEIDLAVLTTAHITHIIWCFEYNYEKLSKNQLAQKHTVPS